MTRTDLACKVLAASGALRLKAMLARFSRSLTILAYHRVLHDRREALPFDEDVVSCTAREFKREMAFVARHWKVISFSDLTREIPRGRPVLIVTFDDGYKDNHDVVLPILREAGVKATFFVTTGCIDGQVLPWWDEIAYGVRQCGQMELRLDGWSGAPLRTDGRGDQDRTIGALLKWAKSQSDEERVTMLAALRRQCGSPPADAARKLMMNWDDVRHLAGQGMEIGSHTVTHPILGNMRDRSTMLWELEESKRRIKSEIGRDAEAFSYPVGRVSRVSDEVVSAVQAAGYRYACVYEHGVNPLTRPDWLRLRRIKAEVGEDHQRFRAKVLFPAWVRY